MIAVATTHQADVAKMVLDESGYTQMWQLDKSPDAEGRLENLTELVNAMQDFDLLQGFWNISLWSPMGTMTLNMVR